MNTAENYKKGIQITEIDTPSIIVDLNIAEENIKKMQSFANDNSVSMRPHSKTNKSPYWAKKQIEAGAIGICCAKLGEAEMMAAGGVKEILIPNQIVTPEKIKRLVEVNKKSKVMIAVENYDNVSKLSEEFEKNSMKLGVIIEVNVGMDRCGVELDEIVDFAKNMIHNAKEQSRTLNLENKFSFYEGDIRKLSFSNATFDMSISTRVLINLRNWEEQ